MDLDKQDKMLTKEDFRIVRYEPFKYQIEQRFIRERIVGSLWWKKKITFPIWKIVGDNGLTIGSSTWVFIVEEGKWRPAIFDNKDDAIKFVKDIINKENNFPIYYSLP